MQLENLKEYFFNKNEHFFLNEINSTYSIPYKTSFNFHFFKFPEQKRDMYMLLRQLLYCESQNLTKQFTDKHSALIQDFENEIIFSTVPSKFIPNPEILYYCCSEIHGFDDQRFKKSPRYFFSKKM